ncbi:MAG: septum formation family protein [Nocardioides sp.]
MEGGESALDLLGAYQQVTWWPARVAGGISRSAAVIGLLCTVLAGCGSGPDGPGGIGPTGDSSGPEPTSRGGSDSPSATASQATASAPTERPARRACYRLTRSQALAPTSDVPPKPCRKVWTSKSFRVGPLPSVADGHLRAVDSASVQRAVAKVCKRRLARYLRADPADLRTSMVRAVWFTPTVEAFEAGANWFRCDVVALADADRLLPLPARLKRWYTRRRADGEQDQRLQMCGTSKPGSPAFERVACALPHRWRAIRTIDIPPDRAGDYPGRAVAREAGATPCTEAARELARDALDFQWGYEWPRRKRWSTQPWGICWAPADGS